MPKRQRSPTKVSVGSECLTPMSPCHALPLLDRHHRADSKFTFSNLGSFAWLSVGIG